MNLTYLELLLHRLKPVDNKSAVISRSPRATLPILGSLATSFLVLKPCCFIPLLRAVSGSSISFLPGCADPLAATHANFIGVLPLAANDLHLNIDSLYADQLGATCAVLSGAVMSGPGYALWYSLLPRLPTITAATAQLAVPVLAAFGGVAFLGEALTTRLLASSALILSGIALVVVVRHRPGIAKRAGQEG